MDLLLTNPLVDFVNKRGRLAKAEKKAGRKFTKLEELQKEEDEKEYSNNS